ncbi:MAG: YbhB/YbcL family Raf kinase inhibitor-like protein [Hahellaceae bacterium]|nr:YbhB/YbcL family Raf kinase inhibitor-like protein [Hahellaceae bacterium]
MSGLRHSLMGLVLMASAGGSGALELKSPGLPEGARLGEKQVFSGFGCEGLNVSPELVWSEVPAGTRSFAVTFYDPDAPTGSGWWHWTVFNIPASVHTLDEGAGAVGGSGLPKGAIQGLTDFGAAGFGGACPPPGDSAHRYQMTVFALDIEQLPLDEQASGAMVGYMLNQHALAKAHLNWTFGR